MAHYAKTSRHPLSSLTNHGLIKFLVKRLLAQNNLTWEQFVGVAVHQAPALAHIRGRIFEQRSLDSTWRTDEELKEVEYEQEEYSEGGAVEDIPMEGIIGVVEENEEALAEEV